jgi:hypothetical protein
MQQFAPPQWQHEHPDSPLDGGAACAQTTGTLCAQTSVKLNKMASSRFTRAWQR